MDFKKASFLLKWFFFQVYMFKLCDSKFQFWQFKLFWRYLGYKYSYMPIDFQIRNESEDYENLKMAL